MFDSKDDEEDSVTEVSMNDSGKLQWNERKICQDSCKSTNRINVNPFGDV